MSTSSQMMSDNDDYQDSQNSSQEQTREVDNQNKNIQSIETTGTLKSLDLETVVQNYKQIGGELMLNLKILENRRQALNKKLTELSHECKVIFQQKEFQMKALVDLQIKLENLDMERVKILNENQVDKTYKTETFSHQLQSLRENDDYLRTTYQKFHDVLKTEKSNFDALLSSTKRDIDLHRKSGETYRKQMCGVMEDFRREYDVLINKEASVILEQTIMECKELVNEEVHLHQEREALKKPFKYLNEEHSNLNLEINQRRKSLIEAQEKLNEMKTNFELTQNELNQNITTLKEEEQCIFAEYERKAKYLSEKNTILESLQSVAENLMSNFLKTQNEKSLKQHDLNSLVEEYKLLSAQLSDEKNVAASLEKQVVNLSSLKENLNELRTTEEELQVLVNNMSSEVSVQFSALEAAKSCEKEVKERLNKVQLDFKEIETNLNESSAEEVQLAESYNKYSLESEHSITEKNNESRELALIIENSTSVECQLNNDIKQAESNINELENSLKLLNDEAITLDNDDSEVIKEEEILDSLKKNLEAVENELISTGNEIEDIIKSLSEAKEIKELEDEIKTIELETKEAILHHNEQIETIETSFASQSKILEDRYTKEIKERDRVAAKAESRTKRMNEAVPRLTHDIGILETDLRKLLPGLQQEIKNALQKLHIFADFYSKMITDSRKKGARAFNATKINDIENQLNKPIKSMMLLEGMPKVDLDIPAPDKYKHVINAFQEKHGGFLSQMEGNSPLEMAEKVLEIGSCVFGKKHVRPSFAFTLNDAEVSSSTIEDFY